MKFNLVVDIDDRNVDDFLEWNPQFDMDRIKNELNNACYLGLGCIESIVLRQTGIETNDTYVKNDMNKPWGELWGDNFPTEKQCSEQVIAHHAQANNIELTDEMIKFARAMWNEGNLTEKLS